MFVEYYGSIAFYTLSVMSILRILVSTLGFIMFFLLDPEGDSEMWDHSRHSLSFPHTHTH